MRGAALALAALFAAGAPQAQELPRFDLLWLPPVRADALRPLPVLINLPPGWRNGDAAVVLLFEPPAAPAQRHALADALLAERAAVVELEPNAAQGFPAAADDEPPPPTPGSLRADLDVTLRVLVEEWTFGLLVAIGSGEAAAVVLEAARAEETPLAAALALAPEGLQARPGAPPAPVQEWPRRAPLLCRAVARAMAAGAAAERACRAELLPPGPVAAAP